VTGPLPAAITAVLAVVVMGGAVAAVGAREHRAAILGLLVALAASPFLADPMPDPRGITARIAGAALAAYLLLIGARDGDETGAAPVPWPLATLVAATAGVAAAAAVLGSSLPAGSLSATGLPEPAGTPLLANSIFVPAGAAGAALLALAAAPIVTAGAPLRLALGLGLAGAALSLLLVAVSGPMSPLADLCLALLVAAIAGAGAMLHRIARRPGSQPARR
jgi:hypothetical protein